MALANEQYYRAGHINSIFSILDWPHTNYETEVRPWICIPGKIFVATPLIPWLVVFRQPLWKMMELLVTWGYEIPNWMEIHVPNNIYIYITYISLGKFPWSQDPLATHWPPAPCTKCWWRVWKNEVTQVPVEGPDFSVVVHWRAAFGGSNIAPWPG